MVTSAIPQSNSPSLCIKTENSLGCPCLPPPLLQLILIFIHKHSLSKLSSTLLTSQPFPSPSLLHITSAPPQYFLDSSPKCLRIPSTHLKHCFCNIFSSVPATWASRHATSPLCHLLSSLPCHPSLALTPWSFP